jgi:hypothetical protein
VVDKPGLFFGFVDADGVEGVVPGGRVVEAGGADVAGHAVVIDLADAAGPVAVVAEELREGDDVGQGGAEVFGEVIDAGGVRREAGQQGGAGGAAEGELGVGAVEADAGAGDAVDVRRFDEGMAVATEAGVEVVDGEEEDVALGGGGREGGEEVAAGHGARTSRWRVVRRSRSLANCLGCCVARSFCSARSVGRW